MQYQRGEPFVFGGGQRGEPARADEEVHGAHAGLQPFTPAFRRIAIMGHQPLKAD